MSDHPALELAERLLTLAGAASPAPWVVGHGNDDACMAAQFVVSASFHRWPAPEQVVAITLLQTPNIALSDHHRQNAEFIAAAREGVPRLSEALRFLAAERLRIASVLRALLSSAPESSPGSATLEARKLLHDLETKPPGHIA